MKVRIFTCHHTIPDISINTRLFSSLVSGQYDADDQRFSGDLGGVNIAYDNTYTEIRHQYFVWKNVLSSYDYVGFEHYRRMFFIDPMPAPRLKAMHPELYDLRRGFYADSTRSNYDVGQEAYSAHWEMRRSFEETEYLTVDRIIGGYDIITQRPSTEPVTIEEQWKSCMPFDRWEPMLESVRRCSYFRSRPCFIDFSLRSPVWNNMYIMRTSLFDEYMRFLMECIDYLAACTEPMHRGWGHHAERIFNFFLFQKQMESPSLRVGRLPYLLRSAMYVEPLPNRVHK